MGALPAAPLSRPSGAAWLSGWQAAAFLDAIPEHLRAMAGCDLVLYQAGADPHISDPLAGGCQKPIAEVVALHVNTMSAALAAHSR